MSNSKFATGVQAALNQKGTLHLPKPAPPQISVPSWKEGSPEWCAAVQALDAQKAKQSA
jgi:hypothetical protein